MTDSLEIFVDHIQEAFTKTSFGQAANNAAMRERWRKVAVHVLAHPPRNTDVHRLAVDLHLVYIGEGHRTEIQHRGEDDPVLLGWRGVAKWILDHQEDPYIGHRLLVTLDLV